MDHLRDQWRTAARHVVAWGEDHAFTITTNTDMTAQKFVRWLGADFNSAWVQPNGTVTACYTHAHVGDVETLLDRGWVRLEVMPQAGKVFVQASSPLTDDQIQSVRVCVVQSEATVLETSTGLGDDFNLHEHAVIGPSSVTKVLSGFTDAVKKVASADVVFDSVSDDPGRWDYHSAKWPERDLTGRTKRVGEITMHLADYGDDKQIFARIGDRVVGTAFFGYVGSDLRAAVQVDPKYRRRGVATAMYVWVEEIAGDKLTPDTPHTPYAEALWNQPNRPFGQMGGS